MSLDALQGSCRDRLAIVAWHGGLTVPALPDAMRALLPELLASSVPEDAKRFADFDGSHTEGS
jgi:hypothetical protein